jgi:hypothetical protein
MDGTATDKATMTEKKKISKRTASYTPKEDVCLCWSWLEQKGKAYWMRVTVDYHERRQLKPFKIQSDRGQVSIQKTWSLIKLETNKFCDAIEVVLRRPKSATSVIDMVCHRPYMICPCAMPIEFFYCMCVSSLHFIMFVGSSCFGLLQNRS